MAPMQAPRTKTGAPRRGLRRRRRTRRDDVKQACTREMLPQPLVAPRGRPSGVA